MTLLHGDCYSKLKDLPDNSVDSIVTDPPYGLKFMGKSWDYDVPAQHIWEECLRVLKPGGHLLAFFGTRTYHRGVIRIEDAGFEIRDQIQWIYGSGFPKSHNIGEGRGTALKPANEPIVLARKPLEKGFTVAENVQKWGTGALNIDASRIGISDDDPNHRKPSVPFTGRVFDVADGKSNGRPTENLNMQGRWPANIILDEEAAAVLDEQSGVLKTRGLGKAGDKFKGNVTNFGGASRFFYVAKASKRERNAGLEGEVKEKQGSRPNSKDSTGKFPDHDHRATGGNNHPTVKPIKLMEYLINLVTPPSGSVLDPFMGSGSTGVAARNLKREFIGIELDEEYFKIAQSRIGGG